MALIATEENPDAKFYAICDLQIDVSNPVHFEIYLSRS